MVMMRICTTSFIDYLEISQHTSISVGDKLEDHAPPRKSKRMMKAEPPAPAPQAPSFPPPPGPLTIFNPYNLFKDVREQVCF